MRDHLEKGTVASVKIIREQHPKSFFTVAFVTLNDKKVKKVILGNVDHFLEVLEQTQSERVAHTSALLIGMESREPNEWLFVWNRGH